MFASAPVKKHGSVELIVGPMFAGKTTELMRCVKREIHALKTCFVVKYARDTRYNEEHVASHDKSTFRANASVSQLSDVGDAWRDFDVIAIDEGQFYPDLYEFVTAAADAGKNVFISALDGDFLRKPFGRVCDLLPMCENVIKLQAVCMMCHVNRASFTRRTVSGSQQELIGGAEMYLATCRDCYNNPVPPSPGRMSRVKAGIREVERATMITKSSLPGSPMSAPKSKANDDSNNNNMTGMDVAVVKAVPTVDLGFLKDDSASRDAAPKAATVTPIGPKRAREEISPP